MSFWKNIFNKTEVKEVPQIPEAKEPPPRCPVRWRTSNIKRDYQRLLEDNYSALFINSRDLSLQQMSEMLQWARNELGEENFVIEGNWWWFTNKDQAVKFALRWYEQKKM